MADCYMYDFPGRCLSLGYPPQGSSLEDVAFILDAMDELGDVIMPLCASLSLKCYKKATGWRDNQIQPYRPYHQIYESSVPEGIVVKLSSDKSISTTTENLSRNTIYSWIEDALGQPSPEPDTHYLEVTQLNFQAVRAKIHDQSRLKNQKFMTVEHDRRGDFKFPLKERDDGLWVYSPIEELETEPSFTIRSGETAKIEIDIHWSWWTEESLKDRNVLEAAILRIIARGWTLEYLNEYLEMPRLRNIYKAQG
jgi:hypothetical protein